MVRIFSRTSVRLAGTKAFLALTASSLYWVAIPVRVLVVFFERWPGWVSGCRELVHSKGKTTQTGLAGGVTGNGFVPGQSGNPGGRPKGLQRRVREEFGNDGDGLVAFLAGVVTDADAKTTDRLEAARILLERGWGKAPIALDTDGQPTKFVLVSAFGVAGEQAA
jgi:hypothetical protein